MIKPDPSDPHYSSGWYAEWWGVSRDTVVRWFADHPGVVKMQQPSARGRRRVELRIPYSVAMEVYSEKSK